MKSLVLLLAVLSSAVVHAATQYPTIDAYISDSLGANGGEARLSTEFGMQAKNAVFGVAYDWDYEKRRAFVFIVRRELGGGVVEVARSNAFDFSDSSGRTDVEAVEAHSEDAFSVQINSRSVCGVYLNKYRFALRKGTWKVIGLDSTEPRCGKNGDIQVGAHRSSNFLTGHVIETKFSNDHEISKRTSREHFSDFPLSKFDPWDERYGPRY